MDAAQRSCYRRCGLPFVFAHRPTSTHWQRGWPLFGEASPRGYLRDALYNVLQNTAGRPPTASLALHTASHSHCSFGLIGIGHLAYNRPNGQACARRSLRLRDLSHGGRGPRYHRTAWR